MQLTNLLYDGTFEGFLSCVFAVYERKLGEVTIQKNGERQNNLFGSSLFITTDVAHSDRVWKGLKDKLSTFGRSTIYYTFLSELPEIESLLMTYIRYVFDYKGKNSVEKDFGNPTVLKVAQIAKQVGREKHRMEAFVRFKLTKDEVYFANVEPDFNVLPLITKHFKSRYADQKWMIYDIRRHYGIYYNLEKVEVMEMQFDANFDFTKTSDKFFTQSELDFQQLWKDYFKSTNIASRKNTKLHIQYVPKRYWKYLSEKQV